MEIYTNPSRAWPPQRNFETARAFSEYVYLYVCIYIYLVVWDTYIYIFIFISYTSCIYTYTYIYIYIDLTISKVSCCCSYFQVLLSNFMEIRLALCCAVSDLDFESGFSYDSLDHQVTRPPNPSKKNRWWSNRHSTHSNILLGQTKRSPWKKKKPKERLLEIIHSGALSGCEWLRCHVMDAEGRLSVRALRQVGEGLGDLGS